MLSVQLQLIVISVVGIVAVMMVYTGSRHHTAKFPWFQHMTQIMAPGNPSTGPGDAAPAERLDQRVAVALIDLAIRG